MAAVSISNLTKSYGELVAVDDVTIEIRDGEIYGLLGPNGAGKTTTIKVLMGLLDPDSGSTKVFGIDSREDPIEVKKLVGYVPEEQQLYESLTPRELFDFIASVRELPEEKTNGRIKEMVKALDFGRYYDSMIVTLSQGNKQKTMLVAALLHRPKLLILDEPFSGLDVRTAKVMKDIVRIHTENGGSVLLSTHIMEIAEGLCDRVGIIDDGELVAVGTLDELRRKSQREGATLEKVFLALTEQEDEVEEGVDTLREALRD
ncbi:MAG: ABC transporter ATP-binding protein [Candidatus Thorarchaeota archaeon]|nr:MAG: ABC transporter ATP-binding protein [Candidatus Thorarchaeota archaeon]